MSFYNFAFYNFDFYKKYFQNRKEVRNPDAISGYSCVKDVSGFVGCWSTQGPCPKCQEKVGSNFDLFSKYWDDNCNFLSKVNTMFLPLSSKWENLLNIGVIH
jgi:hypothetical protein